ncbi:hypothetical protein ALNOE001_07210 [Candidatus Methanobinarius endosymbioticus]|uniref:DUF749 domain-containing protein n=1 Tax=Candidatus Methanobinarius endosymbioticus TaxID=2006182 RepID=A0A366MBQ9_9EURY|nr:hypothetical protein ALNOE001_07210 [Candidatus Methanobinarius endosymbioticus]
MFIATLGGIFKFKDLSEEYGPYVQFKATIEKRKVSDEDEIAILNITGTDSHHVLFLDSYDNIDEIKQELKEADAKVNHTTLKIIEGHLNGNS